MVVSRILLSKLKYQILSFPYILSYFVVTLSDVPVEWSENASGAKGERFILPSIADLLPVSSKPLE